MALAYRTSAQANLGTGDPTNLAFTTAAGDILLVCCVTTATTTARTGGAPIWGTQSFVQAGTTQAGSAECTAELWYLINPEIASQNIVVQNDNGGTIRVMAHVFTGTSCVFDKTAQTGSSTTNPTLTLTDLRSGSVVVDIFGSGRDSASTASHTGVYANDEGAWRSYSQYTVTTSGGNVVFVWTQGTSDDVAFVMASFVEPLSGALSFLGAAIQDTKELFSKMLRGIVTYDLAPAGAVYTETRDGLLSFAGATQRLSQNLFYRTRDGALSFAGSAQRLLQNLFARTKNGAVSTSGLISKIFERATSYSGALTASGSLSVRGFKYLADTISSLSFSGASSYIRSGTQRLFTGAASGALLFIGELYRGWLWGTITRIVERFKSIGGTISMVGEVLSDQGYLNVKTQLGTLTIAGALFINKAANVTKEGIVSFSGRIIRVYDFFRTKTGVLAPSGIVRRSNAIVTKLYDGTLAFSGVVSRGLYITYAGVVDFAGAVSVSLLERIYGAAGVLISAGTFLRELVSARTKTGDLFFSGISDGIKYVGILFYWVGKSGALTLAGSIIGLKEKAPGIYSGTLGIIGRITIIDAVLKRISAASIAPTATLLRKIVTRRSTLTGYLIPSGILSRLASYPKTFAGAVSFAGEITIATTGGIWNYSSDGVASFIGTLIRLVEKLRSYVGAISPLGSINRVIEAFRIQVSQLDFSGIAWALFVSRDWRLGALSFAGDASPYLVTYRPIYMSTLTVTGIVSGFRELARTISGSITPSADNPDRCKDFLYFGPPNP